VKTEWYARDLSRWKLSTEARWSLWFCCVMSIQQDAIRGDLCNKSAPRLVCLLQQQTKAEDEGGLHSCGSSKTNIRVLASELKVLQGATETDRVRELIGVVMRRDDEIKRLKERVEATEQGETETMM
jgi:hypothetical protein